MKCSAITKILCIILICFAVSNNPMVYGDELDLLKAGLTSPHLPSGPPAQGLNFIGLGLALYENPTSTDNLMTTLKGVGKAVDQIESLIKSQPEEISSRLMREYKISRDDDEINKMMANIQSGYHRMRRGDNGTKENAVFFTHGHGASVLTELERLVEFLNPRWSDHISIIDKVFEHVSLKIEAGEWCDNKVSLNEYFYRKYKTFMLNIAKGYSLMVKSYEVLAQTTQRNYDNVVNELRQDYYNFKEKFTDKAVKFMAQSSLSMRRCDPPKHKRGTTFLEFERLIQGYLAHEYNLTPTATAKGTCEEHQNATYYNHPDYKFKFYTKCWGSIFDCMSTGAVGLCPATNPSRRFDGLITLKDRALVYGYFPNLGNTTNCDNGHGQWRLREGMFYRAEPCGCYCDDIEDPTSFRKLDSSQVFADIYNNMVVTGLRLVNESNILCLEIQQGKLEPYGFINQTSVEWKKRDSSWYISALILLSEEPITLSRGVRSLNLNAITLPPNFAIIGVAFRSVKDGKVQLQVYARPISYATGKIMDYGNATSPYSIHDPEHSQSELTIFEPTIPSLAAKNRLNEGKNKFIKLQPSDWKKDAAQTLVPFIDIQEVVTSPPTLLSGLGFAYRSTPGYGGFLGLELQSWNYTNLVLATAKKTTDL